VNKKQPAAGMNVFSHYFLILAGTRPFLTYLAPKKSDHMNKNAYRSFLLPALISLGMILPVFHVHFDEIPGNRIDELSTSDHDFCAICNFSGKVDPDGSAELLIIETAECQVIVTHREPYTESHSTISNLRAPPHSV
jgi:hypothetical protein